MNRIKDLRLEKGVSQNKLAKALGLTQQAISAYENGLREPDLETLNKIANFFNVSVDYEFSDLFIQIRKSACIKAFIFYTVHRKCFLV